ncbi:response regulator transcription factor [Coleofasciculus sp. H7-2]|uniref:response regulator transcription factor n=1 Tax=Coleofasciculus sp. H7-2 TaxID=3351545 RepID=UPI00367016D8
MISVMVTAENPIVRAGLESIIRTSELLEIVGSSSSTDTLVPEELQPDVVLLDYSFSDDDPAEEKLLALGAESPAFVILANNPHSTWLESVLQVGVQAILPRTATAEEIVATVVAAALGLVVLHPDFMDLLPLKESSARRLPASPIQALTPREIEVLGMLALGMGNKNIAKHLTISEHTVKFHVSSIFQKLNASSRTEAVTLGARLGLILL